MLHLLKIIPIAIIYIFSCSFNATDKTVELTITGLRNNKGEIRVGVCKDNENFQNEKSFRIIKFDKRTLVNGTLHLSFEIEHGEYGLSMLDDENSNTKMDYNFIGLPKEGFGFSNYYHTAFIKPHYNDFKFKHVSGIKTKVQIKVRYF